MLGLVIVGVLFSWYMPRCGARHWYHGKAHTLEDADVVSPFPGYLIGFIVGNWSS